jgi:hypothetical protein
MNSMSTHESANGPGWEGPPMWMASARSEVLVWCVTSNGPSPVATIGALQIYRVRNSPIAAAISSAWVSRAK